jgi:chorismate mutase
MPIRGLRGATVAAADTADAIRAATRELLLALASANALDAAEVASLIFTTTPDLTAEPPARTARELGWDEVAMLCVCEMPVPDGLERCIRVLIHWDTEKRADEIRHVYLHAAAQLRPDRAAPARPVAD